MKEWGNYLATIMKKQKGGPKGDILNYEPLPRNKKAECLMSTISCGPNHAAGISLKRELYTWGLDHCKQLGITKSEKMQAKREPINNRYLNEVLNKKRQQAREGMRGVDD